MGMDGALVAGNGEGQAYGLAISGKPIDLSV